MKIEKAYFEFAAGESEQLPESTIPEIVFSGRSNVGKSSLINKLLNRKSLARISSKPGKTGTINFYNISDCRFVDLPGYGYAKVAQSEKLRWADLVEGYFSSNRNIKLVIQIIDIRHNPTEDDLQMINFLLNSDVDFLIVATKSDKLKKTERIKRLNSLYQLFNGIDEQKIIPFSAVNGEGIEKLKDFIQIQCNN